MLHTRTSANQCRIYLLCTAIEGISQVIIDAVCSRTVIHFQSLVLLREALRVAIYLPTKHQTEHRDCRNKNRSFEVRPAWLRSLGKLRNNIANKSVGEIKMLLLSFREGE